MTNSADLHCLRRQDMSCSAREGLIYTKITDVQDIANKLVIHHHSGISALLSFSSPEPKTPGQLIG